MYLPAAKTVIFVCVFNSVFVRFLFIFATSSIDDNNDKDDNETMSMAAAKVMMMGHWDSNHDDNDEAD